VHSNGASFQHLLQAVRSCPGLILETGQKMHGLASIVIQIPTAMVCLLVTMLVVCVRVRWVDHKCKVNSDEFDEEEIYLQARQV
jgi:hypothetical protein